MSTHRVLVEYEIAGVTYRRKQGVTASMGGEVWVGGLSSVSVDSIGTQDKATFKAQHNTDELFALLAAGESLSGGKATVYFLDTGTSSMDRARVLVEGTVMGAKLDDQRGELSLTVTDGSLRTVIPEEGKTISPFTWPLTSGESLDENIVGAPYPEIYGYPGRWLAAWTPPSWLSVQAAYSAAYQLNDLRYASPGYLVGLTPGIIGDSILLIAGHKVRATQVVVYDSSDNIVAPGDVTYTYDLLGQRVAVVKFSSFIVNSGSYTTVRPKEGHEYRVAWGDDTGGFSLSATGGMLGCDGKVLDGAGDIVNHILARRASVKTDAHYNNGLNRYKLDFWISSSTDPDAWVDTHIAKLFPIVKVSTPEGSNVQLLRYNSTTADATGAVEVDTGPWSPVGGIVYTDPTANKVTLDYYYAGGDFLVSLEDVSALAMASQSRWGVRAATISSRVIQRGEVAGLAVHDYLCWKGFSHELVQYEGPVERATDYELGQVVLLSHVARGYSDRVALVKNIHIAGPRCVLDLVVLSRYMLDTRS